MNQNGPLRYALDLAVRAQCSSYRAAERISRGSAPKARRGGFRFSSPAENCANGWPDSRSLKLPCAPTRQAHPWEFDLTHKDLERRGVPSLAQTMRRAFSCSASRMTNPQMDAFHRQGDDPIGPRPDPFVGAWKFGSEFPVLQAKQLCALFGQAASGVIRQESLGASLFTNDDVVIGKDCVRIAGSTPPPMSIFPRHSPRICRECPKGDEPRCHAEPRARRIDAGKPRPASRKQSPPRSLRLLNQRHPPRVRIKADLRHIPPSDEEPPSLSDLKGFQ